MKTRRDVVALSFAALLWVAAIVYLFVSAGCSTESPC